MEPYGTVRYVNFMGKVGQTTIFGQLRKLLKGQKGKNQSQLSACTEAIAVVHFWTVLNAKRTLLILPIG